MAQCREVMISVLIHTFLIMLVILVANRYAHNASELVTVLIASEKPVPLVAGERGGDGKKAGSEGPRKKTISAPRPAGTQVRQKAEAARKLKDDGKRVQPVLPVNDPAEATTAKVPVVPVSGAEQVGPAPVGDGFAGGGGRGIGAYGSGAGFGGQGRGGTGTGAGRGTGDPSKAEVERYLREHYQYIRDLIVKHLVYPSMAKKMGWQGKVVVSFTISETGAARSLKVVESSGYTVLDENVVETIREVQPFPKPPAPAHIEIPIKYNLG